MVLEVLLNHIARLRESLFNHITRVLEWKFGCPCYETRALLNIEGCFGLGIVL